jgi:hypothetical protein
MLGPGTLDINTLVKGGTEFTNLVRVKVEAILLTNQDTPIDGKSVGMMA